MWFVCLSYEPRVVIQEMEGIMMTQRDTQHMSRTTGGILTGTSTLIVFAIIVFIQLLAVNHNQRFDLTKNKRHSLSDQTIKILKSLDQPIQAYSFYTQNDPDFETVKDLLTQYEQTTPNFRYTFIDADRDPVTAEKYDVKTYATTVLTYGTLNRKMTVPSEKELTNGIVKLIQGDNRKTIYMLTLHGELDCESFDPQEIGTLKVTLEDSNYIVKPLNLLQMKEVPDDCNILFIAGPQQNLDDMEIAAIRKYLDKGGNASLFLDPRTVPKLTQMLLDYGIHVGDDLIVDPNGYQNILQPVVESYTAHEITQNFSYGTIFQLVRSVTELDNPPADASITSIAQTHENSWAIGKIGNSEEIRTEYDPEKDTQGPVSIAVVAVIDHMSAESEESPPPQTKLAVFGDSDFINNTFFKSIGNAGLVLNTIHWLAEEKDLIAVPPKDPVTQPMQLSSAQLASAFWIPVVLIPLMILGFGGIRIHTRRKNG
jgi:gliding motility-associatede transport system auxiliary component